MNGLSVVFVIVISPLKPDPQSDVTLNSKAPPLLPDSSCILTVTLAVVDPPFPSSIPPFPL